MASQNCLASGLLALLVLLSCMTLSTSSDDNSNPSALARAERDLPEIPFETRTRVENALNTVDKFMAAFPAVVNSLEKVSRGVAVFASAAPVIGPALGVFFAAVNTALTILPQEDPTLNAVNKGFSQVNTKLDSLSLDISNLATDVEWFNYVSIYSQDEVCIRNAWLKFSKLFKNKKSTNLNHEIQLFADYYEYTQVEACVTNLHYYLTVKDISLTRNLNDLLRKKMKCDISEMSKYSSYFAGLLFKGVVLNEVYWRLTGQNSSGKEDEHVKMLTDNLEAFKAAVETCFSSGDYMRYGGDYMDKMAKNFKADSKQSLAKQVKDSLDAKYSYGNWVVLVYNNADEAAKNVIVYDVRKIPVGDMTVAVAYTVKGKNFFNYALEQTVGKCFHPSRECEVDCHHTIHNHAYSTGEEQDINVHIELRKYAKITHSTYDNAEVIAEPRPPYEKSCKIGWSSYNMYVYPSNPYNPCYPTNPCKNQGKCRQLPYTNEWTCFCPDTYFGVACEQKMDRAKIENIKKDIHFGALTKSSRLKNIESKLDDLLKKCPR